MKYEEKSDIYQKISECDMSRYTVSRFCFCQLQRDNIRFNRKFVNDFSNSSSFICRILSNYILYANSNFGDKLENELITFMKQPFKRQTESYKDRFSLNKELRENLTYFNFVNNKKHNKLKFSINKLLSYLLECYSHHTLAEREKIYFYKEYRIIAANFFNEKSPEILEVMHMSGKSYEVKPYKCEVDDNSFSYYLIGYSREKGSDSVFRCSTISLNRIISCKTTGKNFRLSKNETDEIDKLYTVFGAAYIPYSFDISRHKIEYSVVELTKYGYEVLFLDKISYQRPLPCMEPEEIMENGETKLYRLTFECSHRQIQNYFFQFGNEAFIVKPEWINEIFYKKTEKRFLNS